MSARAPQIISDRTAVLFVHGRPEHIVKVMDPAFWTKLAPSAVLTSTSHILLSKIHPGPKTSAVPPGVFLCFCTSEAAKTAITAFDTAHAASSSANISSLQLVPLNSTPKDVRDLYEAYSVANDTHNDTLALCHSHGSVAPDVILERVTERTSTAITLAAKDRDVVQKFSGELALLESADSSLRVQFKNHSRRLQAAQEVFAEGFKLLGAFQELNKQLAQAQSGLQFKERCGELEKLKIAIRELKDRKRAEVDRVMV